MYSRVWFFYFLFFSKGKKICKFPVQIASSAVVWWRSRHFKQRFHKVTSHMTWFIGSHEKKSAPVGSVSVDLNWAFFFCGVGAYGTILQLWYLVAHSRAPKDLIPDRFIVKQKQEKRATAAYCLQIRGGVWPTSDEVIVCLLIFNNSNRLVWLHLHQTAVIVEAWNISQAFRA